MIEKVSIQLRVLFTVSVFVAMFFIGLKLGHYRAIEQKFDTSKALEKGSPVILSKELTKKDSFSIENFVNELNKKNGTNKQK